VWGGTEEDFFAGALHKNIQIGVEKERASRKDTPEGGGGARPRSSKT